MHHKHASLLKEFAFAINHLVPTVPKNIKQQATELLERLNGDPNASEQQIKQAFFEIGRQEYPHRHAYQELTRGPAKEQMNALVLDQVDEVVRAMIQPHLDSGASLHELVASELFESQMTPEQRYQVENGILVATTKLAESLKNEIGEQEHTYVRLVEKWTRHAQDIEHAIESLATLSAKGNENQALEIKQKVEKFREGFLLTEQDPELEEVKKEIEYWEDMFGQS